VTRIVDEIRIFPNEVVTCVCFKFFGEDAETLRRNVDHQQTGEYLELLRLLRKISIT
jgi:hypothetical protein